jgi:hypothetical protein
MMHIRRIITAAVAAAALAGASPALLAQQQLSKRDQEKQSQAQQKDLQALVQLVDAVNAGKQPAPTDVAIAWDSNHFVKAGDGGTIVPFTLTIDAAKVPAGAAMYVRAVSKNAPPPDPKAKDQKGKAASPYAWDDVQFIDVPAGGKVSRLMQVRPGDYDIFIGVKEKTPLDVPKNAPPAKVGLLKKSLTVPDYNVTQLTTSTPIIATKVEPLAAPLSPEEQRANPYTFGGTLQVTPAADTKLKTSDSLQMLFWVYGMKDNAGKPDVQIDYNFYQVNTDGEKYFNKTAPQMINAMTLPPQFNLAAGHQVLGLLGVALKAFPPGNYRVEYKVTDKIGGTMVTQNATFTIES